MAIDLDAIEQARLAGIWLSVWTAGYPDRKLAEGYYAYARTSAGATKIHAAFTLAEAVEKALAAGKLLKDGDTSQRVGGNG